MAPDADGAYFATPPGRGQSGDALLAEADAAAYRAKRLGGDRACVFDGDLDLAVPPGPEQDAARAP
jgi:predicted signal transduction protein with EAL and GGDEF domain